MDGRGGPWQGWRSPRIIERRVAWEWWMSCTKKARRIEVASVKWRIWNGEHYHSNLLHLCDCFKNPSMKWNITTHTPLKKKVNKGWQGNPKLPRGKAIFVTTTPPLSETPTTSIITFPSSTPPSSPLHTSHIGNVQNHTFPRSTPPSIAPSSAIISLSRPRNVSPCSYTVFDWLGNWCWYTDSTFTLVNQDQEPFLRFLCSYFCCNPSFWTYPRASWKAPRCCCSRLLMFLLFLSFRFQ